MKAECLAGATAFVVQPALEGERGAWLQLLQLVKFLLTLLNQVFVQFYPPYLIV